MLKMFVFEVRDVGATFLKTAKIGNNTNTRTVQTESPKFASVSFDQGFQIWVGWN